MLWSWNVSKSKPVTNEQVVQRSLDGATTDILTSPSGRSPVRQCFKPPNTERANHTNIEIGRRMEGSHHQTPNEASGANPRGQKP